MRLGRLIFCVSILCLGISGITPYAFAQSAPDNSQAPTTTPAPAFGQTAPVLNPENPPVTGLDEPALDLHRANSSFVAPALQVSESADTNGANVLGGSGLEAVTRVLGALDLQQFWSKSDVFLEYLGGGEFYSSPYYAAQLQAFGLEGVTRWRTGQVTLRDAFNYMPDGSFQLSGDPGLGLATAGGMGLGLPGSHSFGNGQFGAIGDIPRLANTAILDAVQALSPKSAITVAGGFSNAHYYDPSHEFINSDQITVQTGYSHLINRQDQIGAVYAFQLFQFPQATGGQLYLHIVNVRYSHNITGRLSLLAGAGPEYLELEEGGYASRWSLSARVQLNYKMAHSSVTASYEKLNTPGAGLYAGASVQAAHLAYSRTLGRTWSFHGDLGYSYNSEIQTLANSPILNSKATHYNEGSVGIYLRKHIGRAYEFFTSYRFSEVGFNAAPDFNAALNFGTGSISRRQIGTVGLEWHPRPTRIE